MPRVDYEKFNGDRLKESSQSICKRVQTVWDIPQKRFLNSKSDIVCNTDMHVGEIRNFASWRVKIGV